MNPWRQVAVIAAVSLAAAAGTFWVKGPPSREFRCDPATLKPDEICLAAISVGADVVWVDARSRADWENNGVPGSLLWNLDAAEDPQAFEAAVAVRVAATPRVIVYCGDENCGVSRQIAGHIRALDLGAEVSVLRGGWRALNEAGRVRNSSRKP
jgi:rhodanese-related sulfurtransferase